MSDSVIAMIPGRIRTVSDGIDGAVDCDRYRLLYMNKKYSSDKKTEERLHVS